MNRRDLHKLFALLAALFVAMPARAAFDDVGAGARGAGMADVQTAVADDAAAAFYNPAGLVQVVEPRLAADMSQEARGLSDGSKIGGAFLGYAQPLGSGDTVLGAGYRSFGVSDLIDERTYLVGAGRRLRLTALTDGVLSVGANARLLQRAFHPGAEATNAFGDAGAATGRVDPVLAGHPSVTAIGLDAGALYQFGPRLATSIGAAAINANRPDISIQSGDKVPTIFKLGVAHRPAWGLLSAEIRRVQRLADTADTDLALGAERYFRIGYRSALTVRGGYAQGSRDYKVVTAGASYNWGRFDFDYAFSFPIGNLSSLDGSQRFGISVKFGGKNSAKPQQTAYGSVDVLHAFASDSLTAHLLMTETAGLTPEDRSMENRLLARRFSLDDRGLAPARAEIRDSLRDGQDWSALTAEFRRNMSPDDARRTTEALNGYVSGDTGLALSRAAVLSSDSQKRPSVVALQAMALGERAASSFRNGQLAVTIDSVRRLTALLPASEKVRTALRQLEAMQAAPPMAPTPEAPAQTAAPKAAPTPAMPVETAPAAATSVPAVAPVPEMETPASAPAPTVEPAAEPASTAASAPVVLPKPVPAVAPVSAPQEGAGTTVPVTKPAHFSTQSSKKAMSPEVKRAWAFYREAVAREVSDYEKVEILESMLVRFGETEATAINKELGRIRARINRNAGESGAN